MSSLRVVSVSTLATWPAAKALEADVSARVPDARVSLTLAEEPADVAAEHFAVLASMFAPDDLSRALVPFALAHALLEDDMVCFFTPDTCVLGDLRALAKALEEGAHAVVVPRRLTPGDVRPGDALVDQGFVALAGDDGRRLADWWCERILQDGPNGNWLDQFPGLGEHIVILRDVGCGVAPWNLDERRLAASDAGLAADGEEVHWIRLPGLAADAGPDLGDVRLSEQPELRGLVDRRRTAIASKSVPEGPDLMHSASGLLLDERVRRLYRTAVRGGDLASGVFDAAGAARFNAWLTDPDPAPGSGGVSRFLFDIYSSRDDLRAVYPDLTKPEDRDGFHGLVVVHGAGEYAIPDELLPPTPPGLDEPQPPPLGGPMSRPWGVNVAGYFQSELGVGEAARRVIDALDAAHVPLLPVQGSVLPASRRGQDFGSTGTDTAPFAVNVICVNADGLLRFARDVGPGFFSGRWNIGMWWWEVAAFPEELHGAFERVDQVWVGSDHVLEALAPVSPVPVVKVRLPVRVGQVPPMSRAALGLPEGFLFLFLMDFQSVEERKNPRGLIEAFTRAFPDGGASLVIKTINGHLHPEAAERVALAASEHADAHVIDGYVSAPERDAMLAGCDCYVSLHRSEGFGITLAEAMYLGKPVVATGYSGNLDFMSPETGWLVPYELVPIGRGAEPYPAAGVWADPDLDAAAAMLREVFDDAAEAARRGRLAAESIRRTHSPDAAGAVLQERLEALRSRVADRQRQSQLDKAAAIEAALAPARARIARGPDDPAQAGGRLRTTIRRSLLRLLRPVTESQREIDQELVSALEELALGTIRVAQQGNLDALALYATALARARRSDDRVDALTAETSERIAAVEAPSRALPFTAGDPFAVFEHPRAGRVLGYRDGSSAVDETARYARFESLFRGSRERVGDLIAPYAELLAGHGPVLDVGAGRGELVEALRSAGIDARGVDSDPGMVEVAHAAGIDVTLGDGLAELGRASDGSLGAVTAIQVIEHLPGDVLQEFFALTRRKLASGGLLVAETVNPHAAHALKTFWVDLTHQQPVFPEVALGLAQAAGFTSAFVCHPRGTRDAIRDRFEQDAYALVATADDG